MSMNFGREMSLLRIRLTAAGSPEAAAARQSESGGAGAFLGTPAAEVAAAAADVVAAHPQMGRAQMTAFVRTLWQGNVHELQAVAARILAMRATLLEPADLPFVEGLLKKCDTDTVAMSLAEALGTLAGKNKKLWKDLRRLAASAEPRMRAAAVRACKAPLLADETAFERFRELAEPLLAQDAVGVLAAVDEVLAAVAAVHAEAVRALAQQHGRVITLPKAKAKPKATAAPAPATKQAPAKKPAPKKAAAKKAAAKKAASKRAK